MAAFYVSHDAGESWERVNKLRTDTKTNPTLDGFNGGTASLSAPRNLSINPHNPREIFLAANWRPCLSSDGGVTWERALGGRGHFVHHRHPVPPRQDLRHGDG